jgi:cysteinyl-tRNA synthetase
MRKGVAYEANGDVYFDVTKIEDFGKLSHQSLEQMMAGARVDIDRKKKGPYDFALWKRSDEDEPGWESPWSRGRPGWHMECSAMSMKYLGPQLDIHGGAKDLIFPHHENEIVQSESYTEKKPFVKYWIHTGFLTINGQKMAKSLGNFITVRDLLEKHRAESLRLFVLSTHYRRPVDFSEDGLIQSEAVLERMYETRDRLSHLIESSEYRGTSSDEAKRMLEEISEAKEKFLMGMDNDFNSAIALASFHELIRLGNVIADTNPSRELAQIAVDTINELGSIFGLFQEEKKKAIISDDVKALILERDSARKQRNWKKADEIREQLRKMGVVLQDTPKGTVPIADS